MGQELVSVVVITYNSSKTVIETLESVYNQTWKNLELIVSDDASVDETVPIVRNWIAKNKDRFRRVELVCAKHNHGIATNNNTGVSRSSGRYIQLIAGDDLLFENAIEKKYAFAEKRDLDIVFTRIKLFGAHMQRLHEMNRILESGYSIMKKSWMDQYNNIIRYNYTIGAQHGFIRRKYFDSIGGFDKHYQFLEDYPLVLRYIVAGNRIELLDEELVKYRVSYSSISTSHNKRWWKSAAKYAFFEQIPLLVRNKMYTSALNLAEFFVTDYLENQ